jgi:dipeptidyl aminopeptidase/acylaminoacyl peptidase
MIGKRIILAFLVLTAWQSVIAQNVYFGQNKVQYRDFNWYFIQTSNFDIYFYRGEDTLAMFAAGALEDAYKEIRDELNYTLTERVPIIIYASHNEFQQTNVISELIPEGVGGFTEVFQNRIVIPFTGSYEDFRHVLHHELTHAVWFDLLYGNAIKSIFSREALFRPPLWFSEGYAEYSSRHGWDLEADMFARDAVIEGYLPPLELMGGFLAYKGGQSAINFISEKYGEEKIFEILSKGKVQVTMERAVKAALGLSMKDLSDQWQKALKRIYWPEIAARKEPGEIAETLTDHIKDGSIYNQKPEWSPKKDRLAFFSDRSNPRHGYSDRFNEIFIISTIDGKIISRLVKAERSGDLESLHSYISGIAWSPDGKLIAFVSKSGGRDVIFIVDAENGDRKMKIDPGLSGMRNPSWSPDGTRIAFQGMNEGFTDLYVYGLENDNLTRLFHDKYDDNDPSWSPDGRFLAFASDRPTGTDEEGGNGFAYGNYNIFLLDIENDEIRPLTHNPYKNNQPAFSPDGERIAFVSNRNGIDNLYLHEINTGNEFPITNIISGAFSPSWSPDGDKIAFSAFNSFGFDIYILEDLKNTAPETSELTLTPFMQKLRDGDENIFVPQTEKVARGKTVDIDTTEDKSLDFSSYIFRAGEKLVDRTDDTEDDPDSIERATETADIPVEDTLEYLLPDGRYKQNRYKLKFSPELVTGGFSYDNFYGLRGQSFLSISDIFGDHHFYIFTDLVNTIDQSNIQVSYAYTGKRIDYAAGIFHFKNLYYDDYSRFYFSDRVYGAQGFASYPFSRFSRLDLYLTQLTVARDNYLFEPNSATNILSTSLEYVNDAVIWGIVGPVAGQRYKITFENSIKAVNTGLSYRSIQGDFRKYLHFWGRYNLALRVGGGGSSGEDTKKFYLGGSSNWIGPKRATADIYGVEDIYVNEIIVPLRGYPYFDEVGTHYGIANLEFRYPFIDYFRLRFPLPITLQQVSGAIFWDMGAAWNYNKELRIFDDQKGFPVLGGVKGGFGFGARANLGIFVLRVDLAWATNFSEVAHKPETYFSFGAEF